MAVACFNGYIFLASWDSLIFCITSKFQLKNWYFKVVQITTSVHTFTYLRIRFRWQKYDVLTCSCPLNSSNILPIPKVHIYIYYLIEISWIWIYLLYILVLILWISGKKKENILQILWPWTLLIVAVFEQGSWRVGPLQNVLLLT